MPNQNDLNTLQVNPTHVRYIKLGPSNSWFTSCKENDRIEFGHSDIHHELAQKLDKPAIASIYTEQGKKPCKANDFAREVIDYYSLGEDCLWITIAEGSLWRAFSQPSVVMLGDTSNDKPVRYRRTIGSWSNKDVNGEDLSVHTLSSVLTKVSAYRQTLCSIEASDYLIRRINAVDSPIIAEAKNLQSDLVSTIGNIISDLHWRDFEVLCDLIFARSGWHRSYELGGSQKDTDLVLEQAATGERAFVQIKSKTDQITLNNYISTFQDDAAYSRMFFCCHSHTGQLNAKAHKPVHVWAGSDMAQQAISAGLIDWLIQKAS